MNRLSTHVRLMTFTLAIAVVLGASSPAAGQGAAKPEFSVGYQYAHLFDTNFPCCFYADFAWPVANPMLTIVGELSGARSESATLTMLAALGGVRVSSRLNPKVVPFGQVLVGVANPDAAAGGTFKSVDLKPGTSSQDFALQLSGGVNVSITDRWGVRTGAGYRRIFHEGKGENGFRVVGGIVLSINR